MRILTTFFDFLLSVLFFLLMILGYALYAVLVPFYRGGRPVKVAFTAFLTLLLAGALGLAALCFDARQTRPGRPFVESVLTVRKGATLDEIALLLTRMKILETPLEFKVLAVFKGFSKKMQAGSYMLNTRMSVREIIDRIAGGRVYCGRVAIPEGATAWQVASLIQARVRTDSAALAALISDSAFAASLGVEGASLEGYLFPETYTFPWMSDPRAVLSAMVAKFHEAYRRNLPPSASVRRYSVRQIVTLASIVEAEAAVPHERPLIAGVFYQRLRKGIPLGADPTIRYALRKYEGRQLTKKDLAMDTPYNTRKFRGLPPGPVGSPGEAALQAALHPVDTPMLYFVAKYDGSREHYFSTTNREHEAMRERSRENSLKRMKGSGRD